MKHSVNFYTEKRKSNKSIDVPILMFVSFKGFKLRYYTRLRCKPNQWTDEITKSGERIQQVSKNATTPSGESYSTINNKLHDLKVEVKNIFERYEVLKIEPTIEALRKDLDEFLDKKKTVPEAEEIGFFDRYKQYIDNSNNSYNTKKRKTTNLNLLKSFRPDATFEGLDTQFLTDFRNHLKKLKYGQNTIICELRMLRSFLNYAFKENWTKIYPFKTFKMVSEAYGDPVYITIEERDLLYNAEINSEHLSRVRDIFVFQCLIGCRVSDLVKLKKSSIIDGCIEYIAGKTKEHEPRVASVPLTEKALKILSKYNLPGDELLPFISDQRYNEYIRDLFKDENVKLNRIVTIRDPKTGTGKQVPISDIASSHMARRVFVGSLYQKGIKNEIIASMSGHTQDSKSFNRYYKIDKQSKQDAISLIE
jgi:site-specific recombinase XerD